MSLFDDVAKASAQGTPALKALSRRDLLRRAGALGAGAVASSALIQSVSAPAYAASPGTLCSPTDPGNMCGGTCAKCGTNGICLTAADCTSGVCESGTCKAAAGQTCSSTASCKSGLTCGYDGVCGTKAADGQSCGIQQSSNGDTACASGYCSANGNNGTCTQPVVGSVGSSCHGATQAVANATCPSGATCKTRQGAATTNGKCA